MLRFDLTKNKQQQQLHFKGEIKLKGVCAIFGDSGAGKTSFMRVIAGLEEDYQGELHFKNQCWQSKTNLIKTENRKLGMVFQEPRLFPHLTALANLKLAQHHQRTPLLGLEELAEKLQFKALLNKMTPQLSGGQKQRIAIARAILSAPDLLLMDEPFSSLDQHSRSLLLPFIKKVSEQIPILYITHALDELLYLSNQMVYIKQGKIIAIGEVQTLFNTGLLNVDNKRQDVVILKIENCQWDSNKEQLVGSLDGQPFYLSGTDKLQRSIQLKIKSSDVIISREALSGSSLLNELKTTLVDIKETDRQMKLLTLKIEKQILIVNIKSSLLKSLTLKVGDKVFAYLN
jgi:molybdate transport system ATP-binding protein